MRASWLAAHPCLAPSPSRFRLGAKPTRDDFRQVGPDCEARVGRRDGDDRDSRKGCETAPLLAHGNCPRVRFFHRRARPRLTVFNRRVRPRLTPPIAVVCYRPVNFAPRLLACPSICCSFRVFPKSVFVFFSKEDGRLFVVNPFP